MTEILLIPVALTCGIRMMILYAKCLKNLSLCSQSFVNGFLLDLSYCCSYLCSGLSDHEAVLCSASSEAAQPALTGLLVRVSEASQCSTSTQLDLTHTDPIVLFTKHVLLGLISC